jgi:hypothetical protein
MLRRGIREVKNVARSHPEPGSGTTDGSGLAFRWEPARQKKTSRDIRDHRDEGDSKMPALVASFVFDGSLPSLSSLLSLFPAIVLPLCSQALLG